jgi:hypothetical protein
MAKKKSPEKAFAAQLRTNPLEYKIGKASAERLSAMTDIEAEAFAGLTISEITKKFPFQIDPRIFLFRKICGTVVKTDPVTGIDYPVPFATVQVEDTDCSFLGYFPAHSPWSWYFPFRCRREVIATTKTDECGKFCVWIPRFDIDWLLRFRRERRCFPIVFERPNLRDLIEHIIPREIPEIPPRGPGPGPDPAPFEREMLVRRMTDGFGRDIGGRLARLQTPTGFGASTIDTDAGLDAPALLDHIRPPLGAELKASEMSRVTAGKSPHPAAQTLANRVGIDPAELKGFDLRRYVGPFKRCFDVFVPEWTPIIDVPDITFRVLQDTNGDGIEEQIYGEGYFQVRWNAGAIGPLTLHAGPHARAGLPCGPTEVIPCGNTPAIVMADLMPVGDASMYNAVSGYAVRTNRPHPSGAFAETLPIPAGQAPLAGAFSLFGCNNTSRDATHYRLMYRYSADNGLNFTAPVPFLGLSWTLYRAVGAPHSVIPDGQGWYPITFPNIAEFFPKQLLLRWPTYTMADGLYAVVLEVGTGGSVINSSAEVKFAIDNSSPTGLFTVESSMSSTGPWAPISTICPVIRRGVTPQDVYFRVTLAANAKHLRSVYMDGWGCGGGTFVMVSPVSGGLQIPPPPSGGTRYEHWHTTVADNDQTLQAIYKLPSTALEGTYSFGGRVAGRQFSPSGYDGGDLSPPNPLPWQYDPQYAHIDPTVSFSVFNSN